MFQILTVLYFISILILTFWFKFWNLIYFKIYLRKRNFCTLTPSYIGNVSFETVTMVINSPQPTLLCVITLFVCLSILYDQDFPFFNFVILSVVVVVPTRAFVGRDVGIIWRLTTETGRGRRIRRSIQRRRGNGEKSPPPPPLTHRGGPLVKFLSHPSTTHICNQGEGDPWQKVRPTWSALGRGVGRTRQSRFG